MLFVRNKEWGPDPPAPQGGVGGRRLHGGNWNVECPNGRFHGDKKWVSAREKGDWDAVQAGMGFLSPRCGVGGGEERKVPVAVYTQEQPC